MDSDAEIRSPHPGVPIAGFFGALLLQAPVAGCAGEQLGATPGSQPAPTQAGPTGIEIVLPARSFLRGNVARDNDDFGPSLLIPDEDPAVYMEYEFEVATEGVYRMHFAYALGERRPIRVLLDGEEIFLSGNRLTGGYTSEFVHEFVEWDGPMTAGGHLLRIEGDDFIPHLESIRLVLRESVPGERDGSEVLDQLGALGYVNARLPAGQESGVVLYDSTRAQPGVNLVVSGHGREAILMDMKGQTLHTWARNPGEGQDAEGFWRRARLLDGGDLLAVRDGESLVRLDRDSKLIWEIVGQFHHDIDVTDDGRIYTLDRRTSHLGGRDIIDDQVVQFDLQGHELGRVSVLRSLENSRYSPVLDTVPYLVEYADDVFHTNTLEIIDGRRAGQHPAMVSGNALVSVRNLNLVGIIDLDQSKFVWALFHGWKWQHQPTLLDNGNILLFDNRGGDRGRSRVVEFDPLTQLVAWEYDEDDGPRFDSLAMGSAQRLQNDNTLVTLSDEGRVIEVTKEGQIVWEWQSPHRSGENGELQTIVCELVRLEASEIEGWLDLNPR